MKGSGNFLKFFENGNCRLGDQGSIDANKAGHSDNPPHVNPFYGINIINTFLRIKQQAKVFAKAGGRAAFCCDWRMGKIEIGILTLTVFLPCEGL